MSKVSLTRLSTLVNGVTAINGILTQIESAFDTMVSRIGGQPNAMTADLDMNSKSILNLPAPIANNSPVRVIDLSTLSPGTLTAAQIYAGLPLATMDTYTALRSSTPSTAQSILVLGRATKGDGSGGMFYAVTGASAGTYVDNDNTIIVPSGGNGSAAWLRAPDQFLKLSSVASLKALTIEKNLLVRLTGYYADNDGGGGMFYAVTGASAGTYVDNGGTVILPTGGNGSAAWLRVVEGEYNLRWFGAKGDLSQDDAPAIQACVNAAAGKTIYAPVGQYRMDSGVTTSLPLNIRGDGTGAGPGPAAQSNSNVTQFILNYTNPSAFTVTSIYPSTFRDFQINVWPTYRPAGSGSGITLSGVGTATTANSLIDNVSFTNLNIGITLFQDAWSRITNCYFDSWTSYAIKSTTSSTTEASTGHISHCFFFGGTTGSQSACIYLENGYTIISENEILGAQVGIKVDIKNYDAGFIRIINNTIEEQYYYGINIDRTTGTNVATMVDISGNEFSAVASSTYLTSVYLGDTPNSVWLTDVSITNNTMRHSGSVALGFIRVAAGKNVIIRGNICDSIGGTPALGIGVVGVTNSGCLASPISVLDNHFVGSFTANYSFAAVGGTGVLLRDMQPATYAKIPANAKSGSMVFVSDGKATGTTYSTANLVVTSGGSGCPAINQGGSWFTTGPFT